VIAYTVHCTIPDPEVATRWASWITGTHIADVCDAGALRGTLTALEGEPRRFEVCYLFTSQESFRHYETEHAPRLRAEGLDAFPPQLGIRYTRTIAKR
jgi:hypothetical protein